MKKIITAVAAVAMAGSLFAADVAAKVQIAGSLFNLKDSKVTALNVKDDATESYIAAVQMTVSGDKAGASVSYANKPALTQVSHSIWFAPIDALKITVGNVDTSLVQEEMDYCNSETHFEPGYGYKVAVNASGFGFEALLKADTNWLNDGKIDDTGVKVGYSADFGTVSALFEMKENAKKLAFGAAFEGNAGGVSYFVDAMGYMASSKFTNIHAEAYCSTSIDAIGISVFLPFSYALDKAAWYNQSWHVGASTTEGAQLGTTAKVTFPVAGVNGYVYVKENDWLNFDSVEVKPGVTGSCGAMNYEVAIDMNIGKKFTLNVPVTYTVNF